MCEVLLLLILECLISQHLISLNKRQELSLALSNSSSSSVVGFLVCAFLPLVLWTVVFQVAAEENCWKGQPSALLGVSLKHCNLSICFRCWRVAFWHGNILNLWTDFSTSERAGISELLSIVFATLRCDKAVLSCLISLTPGAGGLAAQGAADGKPWLCLC